MATNRRDFLKISGLALGLSFIDTKSAAAPLLKRFGSNKKQKMTLLNPADTVNGVYFVVLCFIFNASPQKKRRTSLHKAMPKLLLRAAFPCKSYT